MPFPVKPWELLAILLDKHEGNMEGVLGEINSRPEYAGKMARFLAERTAKRLEERERRKQILEEMLALKKEKYNDKDVLFFEPGLRRRK